MTDKEARKSDFTGDVFGEWTVLRKADTLGDRIRRWIVGNAEGVEMTVQQTGLKDLALAKALEDNAAARDATKPLSRQIAESVLASNALHREAVASVALDNDPECGTYTFTAEQLNPFADMTPVVVETEDVEVETDNAFADDEPCVDCEEEPAIPTPDVDDAVMVEIDSTVIDQTAETERAIVQASLDAILKAKVALNSAAKLLEGFLA